LLGALIAIERKRTRKEAGLEAKINRISATKRHFRDKHAAERAIFLFCCLQLKKTAASCEAAAVDLMPGGEHLDPTVDPVEERVGTT
jgi:hypothetical protein